MSLAPKMVLTLASTGQRGARRDTGGGSRGTEGTIPAGKGRRQTKLPSRLDQKSIPAFTRKTRLFLAPELLSAGGTQPAWGPCFPSPQKQAASKSSKAKKKSGVVVLSLEEKYFLGLLSAAKNFQHAGLLPAIGFQARSRDTSWMRRTLNLVPGASWGPFQPLQQASAHLSPWKETTLEKCPYGGAACPTPLSLLRKP